MKLTQNHIESLVRRVVLELEKKKLVTFNKSKEAILHRGKELINADFEKEAALEQEVIRMLDDIEKQQGDNFERHKMFLMLKRKVAEERGFVL
jgi:hypothetical protein